MTARVAACGATFRGVRPGLPDCGCGWGDLCTARPVFRRGTVFLHGSWLETDRSPAVCRVTAVRRGTVYYGFGPDATKGRYWTSPERLVSNGAVILDPKEL